MGTNRRAGWPRDVWFCAVLVAALAGCAAPVERQAVPPGLVDAVCVRGMPADIRDWG